MSYSNSFFIMTSLHNSLYAWFDMYFLYFFNLYDPVYIHMRVCVCVHELLQYRQRSPASYFPFLVFSWFYKKKYRNVATVKPYAIGNLASFVAFGVMTWLMITGFKNSFLRFWNLNVKELRNDMLYINQVLARWNVHVHIRMGIWKF